MEVAFKATFTEQESFKTSMNEGEALDTDFGEVSKVSTADYDELFNKPIHQDTTEAWNSQPTLIAKAGNLYFYTDYQKVGDVNVAGLKLGDGTSYLIDLPFEDAQFQEHIRDTIVHITQEEREFWNNKNRAVITGENLILTQF